MRGDNCPRSEIDWGLARAAQSPYRPCSAQTTIRKKIDRRRQPHHDDHRHADRAPFGLGEPPPASHSRDVSALRTSRFRDAPMMAANHPQKKSRSLGQVSQAAHDLATRERGNVHFPIVNVARAVRGPKPSRLARVARADARSERTGLAQTVPARSEGRSARQSAIASRATNLQHGHTSSVRTAYRKAAG